MEKALGECIKYRVDNEIEGNKAYLRVVIRKAICLLMKKDNNNATKVIEKAIEEYEELIEEDTYRKMLMNDYIVALCVLGDNYFEQMKNTNAANLKYNYFKEAKKFYSKALEESKNDNNIRLIIRSLSKLGELTRLKGDGELYDAQKYHQDALDTYKNNYGETYELAGLYQNLGATYIELYENKKLNKDRITTAINLYNKAVDIIERNKKNIRVEEYESDLSSLYHNIGNSYVTLNDIKNPYNEYTNEDCLIKALEYYIRALEIRIKLYKYKPEKYSNFILNTIRSITRYIIESLKVLIKAKITKGGISDETILDKSFNLLKATEEILKEQCIDKELLVCTLMNEHFLSYVTVIVTNNEFTNEIINNADKLFNEASEIAQQERIDIRNYQKLEQAFFEIISPPISFS